MSINSAVRHQRHGQPEGGVSKERVIGSTKSVMAASATTLLKGNYGPKMEEYQRTTAPPSYFRHSSLRLGGSQ